eukprot:5048483-Prymnesium_polylepis.1
MMVPGAEVEVGPSASLPSPNPEVGDSRLEPTAYRAGSDARRFKGRAPHKSTISPVCPKAVTPSGLTAWPWTAPSHERAAGWPSMMVTIFAARGTPPRSCATYEASPCAFHSLESRSYDVTYAEIHTTMSAGPW